MYIVPRNGETSETTVIIGKRDTDCGDEADKTKKKSTAKELRAVARNTTMRVTTAIAVVLSPVYSLSSTIYFHGSFLLYKINVTCNWF